jgi:hypothetical protein
MHAQDLRCSPLTTCLMPDASTSQVSCNLPTLHPPLQTYGLGAGLFYLGYSLLMVPSQLLLLQVGAPVFLGGSVMAWGGCVTLFCSTVHPTSVQHVLL